MPTRPLPQVPGIRKTEQAEESVETKDLLRI